MYAVCGLGNRIFEVRFLFGALASGAVRTTCPPALARGARAMAWRRRSWSRRRVLRSIHHRDDDGAQPSDFAIVQHLLSLLTCTQIQWPRWPRSEFCTNFAKPPSIRRRTRLCNNRASVRETSMPFMYRFALASVCINTQKRWAWNWEVCTCFENKLYRTL